MWFEVIGGAVDLRVEAGDRKMGRVGIGQMGLWWLLEWCAMAVNGVYRWWRGFWGSCRWVALLASRGCDCRCRIGERERGYEFKVVVPKPFH